MLNTSAGQRAGVGRASRWWVRDAQVYPVAQRIYYPEKGHFLENGTGPGAEQY